MVEIKFGTDGWRAIIAKDFTVDNVYRVAAATAIWLNDHEESPSVVIGHDCRFGGELFAEAVVNVMMVHKIKAFLAKGFVSTPMISLGVVKLKANMGIVITASHNPPDYNGYKIKAHFGGPAVPAVISEIENMIPAQVDINEISLNESINNGNVELVDLETMYCEHVQAAFDMKAIFDSGLNFGYDAMFGAGQNVIKRLFPDTKMLHCEDNPSFHGQAPEPIDRNLSEFREMIKNSGNIDCGLATDGDADRIGMYDNKGGFIDSHHIILLLLHYLYKYKKQSGKVITTFSCTQKIAVMCDKYGLEHITTKIGFKYICELMSNKDENVLIGGEESGGIAINGHVPERDGLWIGFVIWESMAKTGKSMNELIQEVYDVVGKFAVERNDLHITEDQKKQIMDNCLNRVYTNFADLTVEKIEDLDGYKFHFANEEWVMIRPSGTEPILRTYAEASTSERAFEILKATEETILKSDNVLA